LGLKCYSSIDKIRGDVELVAISTPARTVPEIIRACGEKGVKAAIVFSAGFKEGGREGMILYNELIRIAGLYNIRLIGPNCFGVISPVNKLNISFATQSIAPGKIAVISQSGAICVAILDWALEQNVGFSHFISIGSMADISFHQLIDYLGNDEETESILVYMESLSDTRAFLSAARAFARNKPIIVLKTGVSQEGAKAAMSHTGSLAGNDEVFDAAFRRVGIIRVHTIQHLFDIAQALSMQGMPKGAQVAILTNAGGPGILATDYLVINDGKLAKLSGDTMKKLDSFLPAIWSKGNPIDITGNFTIETYRKSMDVLIADPSIDAMIVMHAPTATADPSDIAAEVIEVNEETDKTILAVWMGEKNVIAARDLLEQKLVPVYRFPESAIHTFLKMRQYATNIEAIYQAPPYPKSLHEPDKKAAKKLIHKAYKEKRKTLTEAETKELLSIYGFPVLPFKLVKNLTQLRSSLKNIRFPIAMKIVSPDIMHKTESGGVKLNIQNLSDAEKMFEEIMYSVKSYDSAAHIDGVIIESMASHRYELIIGSKKDPIFGPVIVFGRGGTEVEVYKDYQMAIPPLDMGIAERMVKATKVYNVLKGFRGRPPVNLENLYTILTRFSRLLEDHPEIAEFDINPMQIDEDGMAVLDAKVLLEEKLTEVAFPDGHFAIAPVPRTWNKELKLKNDFPVLLRPIRAEDEAMEYEMIRHISRTSLYYRFFGYPPEFTHDFMSRFTNIDYDREMAFVAEHQDHLGQKHMLGVVRVVHDLEDNHGELAIIVADPWHRIGIASALLNHMVDYAKSRKMPYLNALFLHSNKNLKQMLEKFGFEVKSLEGEFYQGKLVLKY
jgi:acetyltransferase